MDYLENPATENQLHYLRKLLKNWNQVLDCPKDLALVNWYLEYQQFFDREIASAEKRLKKEEVSNLIQNLVSLGTRRQFESGVIPRAENYDIVRKILEQYGFKVLEESKVKELMPRQL